LAEPVEVERRRLAGMLPGADVVSVDADAAGTTVDIVALVTDLDGPIPVLVERGGYELVPEHGPAVRVLLRAPYRLTLTTDRGVFTAAAGPVRA
jgi:hypothetical protein